MRRLLMQLASVLILLLACPVALATQQQVADQAFMAMHYHYVTLPGGGSERLARSTMLLPEGWPTEQPKGLIERQFVDQAVAMTSSQELVSGVW